ncbi:hypothetical protein BDQ12DRAFT_674963 [Crucibulum laeve]|uniref:Uncharacterized protein n=1 Tax=Crucibulum laeve TaxID=68775 RepID=A0A5C3MHK8_9AGAR|nr:hypothetical protein BDQ12DRAFT_674963 [Crucibulum laeve]
MPFRTRNSYYLRISSNTVLPLHLYLDERHLNWMSDLILQHVLADLRPNILPKLKVEAKSAGPGSVPSKGATVDTHRGNTYQFCYFFRQTEPHSVVIKNREFIAVPKTKKTIQLASSSKSKKTRIKRKGMDAPTLPRKKRRTENTDRMRVDDEDYVNSGDEDSDDQNESIDNDYEPERDMEVDVDLEIEEEEKPKPLLRLNYQGFNIFGHCLCIVVEPWPIVRSSSQVTLGTGLSRASRAPRIASSTIASPPEGRIDQRAQTPLFLPDNFDERGETPARTINQFPISFDDTETNEEESDSDVGGMMEFSQVLNIGGESGIGSLEDDDELDGAVFFGDADDVREL